MSDILERAARIERKKAQLKEAQAHLPAIENELRKARLEYREASQKARGLWIQLCKRSGVPEEKYMTIEGFSIIQEDDLNQQCREAVKVLNKKAARLRTLLVTYQKIRQGHQ